MPLKYHNHMCRGAVWKERARRLKKWNTHIRLNKFTSTHVHGLRVLALRTLVYEKPSTPPLPAGRTWRSSFQACRSAARTAAGTSTSPPTAHPRRCLLPRPRRTAWRQWRTAGRRYCSRPPSFLPPRYQRLLLLPPLVASLERTGASAPSPEARTGTRRSRRRSVKDTKRRARVRLRPIFTSGRRRATKNLAVHRGNPTATQPSQEGYLGVRPAAIPSRGILPCWCLPTKRSAQGGRFLMVRRGTTNRLSFFPRRFYANDNLRRARYRRGIRCISGYK